MWDDVHGDFVFFRVCFDGEEFCRPQVYRGHASVPGERVTVAPYVDTATHGVVIVR